MPAPNTGLAISTASAKPVCMSLEFIKPQLATSVDQAPPRAGWIHEVKHDGYRTLLIIERGKARAYTRNGFDWSESYLGITRAASKLDCRSAIIDGEVVVQNERGISDFEALKSAIRWHPQRLILRLRPSSLQWKRPPRPAIGGAKGQAERAYSESTSVFVQ
jgi:ATP-dependent DNA ligase